MKFSQFLAERAVPNIEHGINRMRHAMPQISDHDKFIADLKSDGHKFESVKKNPESLKPTQKNFNWEKVDALKKKESLKPVVISNDGYVVDGHHRWLANCENKVKSADCFMVDMSIHDVLEFLKGKPYVKTKKIHEAVLSFRDFIVESDSPPIFKTLIQARNVLPGDIVNGKEVYFVKIMKNPLTHMDGKEVSPFGTVKIDFGSNAIFLNPKEYVEVRRPKRNESGSEPVQI